MSFAKPFAVVALLSLAAAGSTNALASETESTGIAACTTGSAAVFRGPAHPAKSALFGRHVYLKPLACKKVADTAQPLLASFTDAVGGQALVRGQPERAIRQIEAPRMGGVTPLELNNLCVAHTVLRQWSDAQTACDAAVEAAVREQQTEGRWPGARRRAINKVAATAFSNRAVMHWMSEDVVAAQGDYARARELAPKAVFVERNTDLSARLPARVEYATIPTG